MLSPLHDSGYNLCRPFREHDRVCWHAVDGIDSKERRDYGMYRRGYLASLGSISISLARRVHLPRWLLRINGHDTPVPVRFVEIPKVLEACQVGRCRPHGGREADHVLSIECTCYSAMLTIGWIKRHKQLARVVFRFLFTVPLLIVAVDGLVGTQHRINRSVYVICIVPTIQIADCEIIASGQVGFMRLWAGEFRRANCLW